MVCYRSEMVALDPELLAPEKPRPLRRAEFDRLIAAGAFDEDERIELLHGCLVETTPPDPPHADVTSRLGIRLIQLLAGRAHVRLQNPFAASDDSEPGPDIAVVPEADYGAEHPNRAFLVVEVADSSLSKDRSIKAPLYARSGIGEYWIVNLADSVIEVHRDAQPDGTWRHRSVLRRGETLSLISFPDVSLRIEDVLPTRRA
jgi:Uma2 family endonuclease